ncbi:hypothetical protein QUB56_29315, partial [Microcoleus sp. AR_TQ3_B6]|uniref:hypothetical protein n=1 Tax=Microcoleus sp. AR_TQ3_B6 TaxID=3055284 RepID=UPI002FD07F81
SLFNTHNIIPLLFIIAYKLNEVLQYITTLSPHLLGLPNPGARNSVSGVLSGFPTHLAQKPGFSQQLEGKE